MASPAGKELQGAADEAAGTDATGQGSGARPAEQSSAPGGGTMADGNGPLAASHGAPAPGRTLVPTQGGALAGISDLDLDDDFELPAVLRPDTSPPPRTGPRLRLSQLSPVRPRRDAPPALTTVPGRDSSRQGETPSAPGAQPLKDVLAVPLVPANETAPLQPVPEPPLRDTRSDPGRQAAPPAGARVGSEPSPVLSASTAGAAPAGRHAEAGGVASPTSPAAAPPQTSAPQPSQPAATPRADAAAPTPVETAPPLAPPAAAEPPAAPAVSTPPLSAPFVADPPPAQQSPRPAAMPFLDTRMRRMAEAATYKPLYDTAPPPEPAPELAPPPEPLLTEPPGADAAQAAEPLLPAAADAASDAGLQSEAAPEAAAEQLSPSPPVVEVVASQPFEADPFAVLPVFDAGAALAPVAPPPLPAVIPALPLDPLAYADSLSNDVFGRVEDGAADLLRPLLREWLSHNMPRIVEKALRIEVARAIGEPPDKAS